MMKLNKLKGNKKLRDYILYCLSLLLLLFFTIILLGDNAGISLFIVCFASGMCSLIIGQTNSLTIKSLGIGKTRKQIEYNLIKELLILSINTIVLIGFDLLFILIVNGKVDVKIRLIIFTYLFSLLLCLLSNFIKMNYKNLKLMIIPGVILLIFISFFFIKNFIVVDIILLVIIIGLYFLSRYNIYNKTITK